MSSLQIILFTDFTILSLQETSAPHAIFRVGMGFFKVLSGSRLLSMRCGNKGGISLRRRTGSLLVLHGESKSHSSLSVFQPFQVFAWHVFLSSEMISGFSQLVCVIVFLCLIIRLSLSVHPFVTFVSSLSVSLSLCLFVSC